MSIDNPDSLINSFEELGWIDPEQDPKHARANTLNWLRNIKFENFMYPDNMMQHGVVPNCMFVPSKELLRRMIRIITKCKTKADVREVFGNL
jgi:hypothetical protein